MLLSVNPEKSIEMIVKWARAFENSARLTVIFKPHPTLKEKSITRFARFLPEYRSFTTEPLGAILATTDLAIYSDSTGAVEALARGIPVLYIKSNFLIDINLWSGVGVSPPFLAQMLFGGRSTKC